MPGESHSHAATKWAIQQRGPKPATKIVLWFLCDRHNPDFGCFPTRRDYPAPPDGPKALDRAMERAARRDAQIAATSAKPTTAKRQPKRPEGARPSADELAAFDADMVNSSGFRPANTISNTIRDAMLSRGHVTPERLRARGVHRTKQTFDHSALIAT